MSKTLSTAISAGLIAGMASFALAGTAMAKRGGMFDFAAMDTDNSGGVSKAEIMAHGQASASEIDTNGDGEISTDELKASFEKRAGEHGKKRAGKRMERWLERAQERIDANDDGVLSVAEWTEHRNARLDKMFEKLDADNSGEITQAEFKDARKHGKRHGKRDKAAE